MSRTLRILFLEDSVQDAELAVAKLEGAGYVCRWDRVQTRKDFEKYLQTPDYDLVLSDYHLSSFDGPSALKMLVKSGLDIPFILISGDAGEEKAIEAIKAGASEYVLKDKLVRLPLVVERALKETEERRNLKRAERLIELQAMALTSAANAIVMTDRHGAITWVNPAFTSLTGYEAEEVIGKDTRILKSGKHDTAFYAEIWKTILSGRIWHGDLLNRRKDGTTYCEEQTITPVVDDAGDITHFIAIKQDITGRKLAEYEIKYNEQYVRAILDNIGGFVGVFTPEGIVLETNRLPLESAGSTREDVIGKEFAELPAWNYSPEVQAEIREIFRRVAAGETVTRDLRPRMSGGVFYDVSAVFSPFLDENGNVAKIVGSAFDITQRKCAEKALLDSEDRNRDLVENAVDIIYTHDLKGNFTSANGAALTILGYTASEAVTMNIADTIVPEYLETAREMIAAKLAGKEVTAYELEVFAKDGRRVAVEVSTRILCVNGTPVGVQGIARDITDRKRAADALQKSEASFRSLFDTANDAILVMQDGVFTACNARTADIFGCWPDEIIGCSPEAFSPPFQPDGRPSKEKAAEYIDAAMSGMPQFFEWQHTRMDGTPFDAEVSLSKVDIHGSTRLQAIVRDISDRKRSEAERRVIFDIIQGAAATHNLDEFLALVHKLIGTLVYAENCFVMLHEPATDSVRFEYWADKCDPEPPQNYLGTGYSSYVLRTGKPLRLTKDRSRRLEKEGKAQVIGTDSPSWMGVPLSTAMRTLGVLVVQHYEKEDVYSEHDLEFLASVGNQIAVVIERKRAEEALRDSEEQYRLLFEKNPVPMWVYDLTTLAFLEVNHAAVAHYGYSRREFLSMTMNDLRPADQTASGSFEEEFRDLRRQQSWVHKKKEGTLIDVEITSHALSYLGRPSWLVLAKDVTETKRIEKALSKSEERYRDLVENALDIIYTHDLDGNYTSANKAVESVLGYTIEEAVSRNLANTVTPECLADARRMMDDLLACKDTTVTELEVFAKDGRRVAVEVNARLLEEDGVTVGVQGIARDITSRRQAEEALAAANIRAIQDYEALLGRVASLALALGNAREVSSIYGALLEFAKVSMPVNGMFVSVLHPEKNVRSAAYAWSEGKEYDVSELPPMAMSESPHSRAVATGEVVITNNFQEAMGDLPRVDLGLKADPSLPQSSLAVPMTVMGKVVGGVEVQSTTVAAYTEAHGTAMQMAANLTANALENVRLLQSEAEKAEQLRHSQKLESVGMLAGGIAHDFNNLLTVINGYGELLSGSIPADDPKRKAVEAILEAGDRAAGLTSQLLAFSRKAIVQPATVDLNDAVRNVKKMLGRLIGEDIELTLKTDDTIWPIVIDPSQLDQVLMNLAVNGRDAMPTGGKLMIETFAFEIDDDYIRRHPYAKAGRYVVMAVTDTGSGMTPEVKERIFEPFFTTKGQGRGTGLGLATIYGIVKQAGGHVEVYSEIGKGTCFKVYFPEAPSGASLESRVEQPRLEYEGYETILIVEDEDMVRQLAVDTLRSRGYHTLSAADAAEAQEVAAKHDHIDLVFTDVVMPGSSGTELAATLSQTRPGLKVLFSSGYTDDAVVRHGMLEPGTNFLQKPYSARNLARKLREILDQKH